MQVSLKAVDKSNYEAVFDLEVAKSQQNYVAPNSWSLVEAAYNEGYETRAIYLVDQPVGFLMWVQETETKVSIWRFMVDVKFQRKGIGRRALELALDDIKSDPKVVDIEICYDPKNPVAKPFYGSFGFVEQGLDEEGEEMLALIHR